MGKLFLGGVFVVIILIIGATLIFRQQAPTQIEEIAAPTPTPATGEVREFTVSGRPFRFSAQELRVRKGDTVRVTFLNEQGIHDWRIDGFQAATAVLQQGQQETIEFIADQTGEFEYYCSVANHRELGMKGALIVEE